jgi:hypothetical protein
MLYKVCMDRDLKQLLANLPRNVQITLDAIPNDMWRAAACRVHADYCGKTSPDVSGRVLFGEAATPALALEVLLEKLAATTKTVYLVEFAPGPRHGVGGYDWFYDRAQAVMSMTVHLEQDGFTYRYSEVEVPYDPMKGVVQNCDSISEYIEKNIELI